MANKFQQLYPDAMDEQEKVAYLMSYAQQKKNGFGDKLPKWRTVLAIATAPRNDVLSPPKSKDTP